MIEFIGSVTVGGWVAIALLAVGIVSLPRTIRNAMGKADMRDRLPLRSDGRPDVPPPGSSGAD